MALWLILLLYAGIGILAAGGSIAISARQFAGRSEQVFYGLLLTPIAAIYLAFTAHYQVGPAWRPELIASVLFAVAGLLGTRLASLLIVAYLAHGSWDLLHEVALYNDAAVRPLGPVTAIPLAYGVFCATFDWCIAGYFYTRRTQWAAAWRGEPAPMLHGFMRD